MLKLACVDLTNEVGEQSMKDAAIYQQTTNQARVNERESLQVQTVQDTESFFEGSGFDSSDLENLMAELDAIEQFRESS